MIRDLFIRNTMGKEYLSYLATTLVLSGVYYISRPKLRGQYIMLMADFTWLLYSLIIHSYALSIQSIVLFTISLSAIKNWNKEGIGF